MSASVRGVSSSHISGTTSVTFTQPASSAQGDLQLIIMESCDSTTTAGTPATPSGWTKIHENTIGTGASAASTCTIFARIAPSSPADQLVDGVLNHISGRMIGFTVGTHGVSNVATDIVVGTATDHGTSTATVNTASINVEGASLIVWVTTFSDDASDTTNAQNHTNSNLTNPLNERWDNTVATGAGGGQAVVTAVCAGTTTGVGTWDHDTAEYSQSVYLGIPAFKVTAVLAAPLGSLTGTAAAAPKRSAVLAAPLGSLTGTAAATYRKVAALAAPLGSLAGTAAATVEHPATLVAPLGALTATAAATVTAGSATVSAALAAPLGALAATAAATASTPVAPPVTPPSGGSYPTPRPWVTAPPLDVDATATASLGALVARAIATVHHVDSDDDLLILDLV